MRQGGGCHQENKGENDSETEEAKADLKLDQRVDLTKQENNSIRLEKSHQEEIAIIKENRYMITNKQKMLSIQYKVGDTIQNFKI